MAENTNTAEEATMDELIKLIEQRAATYGLLSRLFRVKSTKNCLTSCTVCASPPPRATPMLTRVTCVWRSTCPTPGRTA